MGVFDFFRGLITRPRPTTHIDAYGDGLALSELPLSRQLYRVGGAMTPEEVSVAMRLADAGQMWQLALLGEDARQKDLHLQSILGTREMCAASLPWQVTPAGAERRDKVRRNRSDVVSEWVTESLKNAAGGVLPTGEETISFSEAIAHLAGAAYHGRAVCEVVYDTDGRHLVPTGFSCVQASRISFSQFTGRIVWWDPNGDAHAPGIELASFAPGKLITHRPRINGDRPQREGLLRVLLWAALFRNWDLRDWVAFGELAWKPWRIGTYKKTGDKEADKKDIANLEARLRNMSSSGVLIKPDTTEVEIAWPENSAGSNGGTHKELFATLGAEMSKAVLGQTLTTEQGARGSQALGKVHDKVRSDILEFDATSIAATIQRDLIVPMVRRNFGDDAPIPTFSFITDDEVDLVTFANGVKTLRDAGLKNIPARWVRGRAGIPESHEDEEVLGEVELENDPKTGLPMAPGEKPEEDTKPSGDGEKPAEDPAEGDD